MSGNNKHSKKSIDFIRKKIEKGEKSGFCDLTREELLNYSKNFGKK
jgi:hypothetical protein